MSQVTETEPRKSSAEILSELFSTFNAYPPILKDKVLKKHKKSKKKHKRKEKKHKKKSKHKRNSASSDDSSEGENTKKRIKKELIEENVNAKEYDPNIKIKTEPIDNDKNTTNNVSTETENKSAEQEKLSVTKTDEVSDKQGVSKITIKDLKNSTAYEAAIKEIEDKARERAEKYEDGEVTSDNEDDIENCLSTNVVAKKIGLCKSDRKKKHSHRDINREKSKHDDTKKYQKKKHKKRSRTRSRSRSRSRSRDKDRHSNKRTKSDYYYSSRYYKDSTDRYRDRYREDKKYSKRSRSRDTRRSRSVSKDNKRSRSRDERRSRSRSRSKDKSQSKCSKDYKSDRKRRFQSPSSSIDKKKLLEIARKNAINMLKSGTLPEALTLGPQAQEKVIAAIKAGGKTIEELTDFCKNLSKKEELGELSSVSSNEDEIDSTSESEKVFHHPFQLKDKPTSIVMNIKNSTPLPIKTSKEKSTELRMQFPVSSGQLHRKTENEWVPVSPKKTDTAPIPSSPPLPLPVPVPLPPPPPDTNSVLPPVPPVAQAILPSMKPLQQSEVDISSIVSQRLNAMRKLQENPNDVQAINQMYKVQQEMQNWAVSKQQIGQFTGSTGAQILSPAELSSGYQAWARKDQLQNAAPVTGGMGMHLLQKMGWKPGEGLGKEKTGSLEPLLLEVKLDKKGLVTHEEVKTKKPVKIPKQTTKTLAGKHPVSLLGEYATKRKLGVPQYECCFECGPDHKKNFLFKVIVNGVEYKANIASSTKKQAKADAATVCLQQLGLLLS